jgi:hypothetical protein
VSKKKIATISIPCKGLKPSKARGFSCKQEVKTAKQFIATHRARSKGYDSLSDIPVSVQVFIDSTG